MKDEKLLSELRAAGGRAASAEAPAALDVPLGEAFEANVANLILAKQRAERTSPAVPLAPPRKASSAPAARPGVRLVTFAALPAAAALLLALTHPWNRSNAQDLPAYALAVTGGQDTLRSAGPASPTRQGAAAPPELRATADALLTVTLRPPTDVTGPLDVKVLAVRGATVTEVRAGVRTSPSGSVEVHGTAGELVGAEPGDVGLVIVVARHGVDVDARAAAKGGALPHGAAAAKVNVRVLP